MTTTKSPATRQTLAVQLDRLDGILDGLAEAIPAAVADAVRTAVAHTVREAVQTALAEVLARPAVQIRMAADTLPPTNTQPSPINRFRRVTIRIRTLLIMAKPFGNQLRTMASKLYASAQSWTCRQCSRIRSWRKPILTGVGIAMAVSFLGYVMGPVVASMLCGASAFGLSVSVAALATALRRPAPEAKAG